jgi:integrase
MMAVGADPKLVQAQLGHASISITFDIYGHLFPDRLDELASDLDRLIRKARQGPDQSRGLGRSL